MPCHEQLRWTKGLEGERAGIPSKVALIQVCDMVNDIYIYTWKNYSNESTAMSLSATSFPMPFVFFFCLFLVGDTPAQNPQFSMADQVAQSGMVEN